jgi:Uma2 family endonuclease
MATLLRLGPKDHGRPLTFDEFRGGEYEEGYHYELINGRLYVVPVPNLPDDSIEVWISDLLRAYRQEHPEVINHVTNKARVFVPGADEPTAPEPDVAAYHDFPHRLSRSQLDWGNVSPLIVVEVVSADDPDKDLVRNLELYLQVPSIREYWILDGRADPDHPTLLVYRRRGRRWSKVIRVLPGKTYTTPLLPGFTLTTAPPDHQ